MNIILRFFAGLFRLLDFISFPMYWLIARGKKQKLPPITDPILKINATDLAEKIRNKEISCEHVCNIYIKRIKEVNPFLNAIVEERFEKALKDARDADIYLKSTSLSSEEIKKIKPLLGVPLTVKESCGLVGLSFAAGTLGRKGIKAETDGKAVAALKVAGAIPLLVSNTPELCMSWESRNFLTGATNNPYDTSCTSSGSSGGEGALLGAGASVIGLGSDVAGSIRMPALFNGIFGHKPTSKLIPVSGHYPECSHDYLVVGPMTRYAKDLKLLMQIMARRKAIEIGLYDEVDLSTINIFHMHNIGNSLVLPKVQDEIVTSIDKSVDYLKNVCQSKIMDYKFKELTNSYEIGGSVLLSMEDIPYLLKGENQNLFLELCKSLIGYSSYSFNILFTYLTRFLFNTFTSSEKYCQRNIILRNQLIEKLGSNGVLLIPTFPTAAFKHKSFYFKSPGITYLMIFNTLGFPSTHVPCGLNKQGMPIGLQVVAAPHQDRLCLAVAEALEKCFGGWIPPS